MTIQHNYPGTYLAEAVWPRQTLLRDLTFIIGGGFLLTLLAQIEIPLRPVPVTGQTLGVVLIGALLGSRRGALSVLTYLGWGAMGLPVFAGGASGLVTFAGTTAGYLAGFVPAAFVVGWLCERGWDRSLGTAGLAMLLGNIVIYLFGLPWLAGFTGWAGVLEFGLLPFIPGDLIKIVLAALALPGGWALVNRTNDQQGSDLR